MSAATITTPAVQLAYSRPDAAKACAVSLSVIDRAVRAGELPVRYPTSRGSKILHADLAAWVESWPDQPPTD